MEVASVEAIAPQTTPLPLCAVCRPKSGEGQMLPLEQDSVCWAPIFVARKHGGPGMWLGLFALLCKQSCAATTLHRFTV